MTGLEQRLRSHPGRGGCGVGAVARIAGATSHEPLALALRGLACLEHRGGAIDDTGDGAGLLLTTDQDFFARFVAPGRRLPDGHHLGVGMLFFPVGEGANLPHLQRSIEAILRQSGLQPLGFRHVPVDDGALGASARASRRDVWQLLFGEGMVAPESLPLVLHRVKAQLEAQIRDLYVVSLSARTLVYKALATGEQLPRFYPDLVDPSLRTRAAVFHRRYSTNTFSNWYLAQVFRALCHNGEINTIKANRGAAANLEVELHLPSLLMPQGSDSADMDRVVELFLSHGVSLPETLARLMPAAWRDLPRLTPETVRYYRGVQRALGALGAWEGPAAIVASDGKWLVAALDRMGLRPLRWTVGDGDLLVIGSEVGAVPIAPERIASSGQLEPGEAIALDLDRGELLLPDALRARIVGETRINAGELSEHALQPLLRRAVVTDGKAGRTDAAALNLFGWTSERVRTARHLAETGKEPITSMGFDRPLAAMSALRPPLSKYFKQIVAVVTNPPVDPYREGGAFDLTVHLGPSPTVNEERARYQPRPQWKLESPFLTADQLQRVRDAAGESEPRALLLDATFDDPGNGVATGAKALARRIEELVRAALSSVRKEEASILLLSDRASLRRAPGAARLPVPMVLGVAALHDALVRAGLRRHATLVVESGEISEGHDAALLLGCGADALHPYLLLEVGAPHGTIDNLCRGLDETLRRVMSKMGICSLDGYRGSRLFEAVGVAAEVVDYYLPGIVSRIGGVDLADLYDDLRARHALGASPQREPDPAVYRKDVWSELQTTARGHDPASFDRFLDLIAQTPPVYLRDLLELKPAADPISVEEVASEEEIIAACFRGAAMSHGALHRVAHRAIAAAFNGFGAASNCGEGGEDTRRDRGGAWEEARSRIRQVASGRFGVDARYLVSADEISIKIGQGAKPGEGGMLPGAKVTEEVARIRKTQVGVTLISPPPHHDIYSIEDLAQLIYDLRQVNPGARVSVKIPAVTDIGTIAVGIAKAGADVIDVSGFEGGTGAAAASSIEHAGLPLERALSETHQALVVSGVRARVRLRADGGIKTGFDVAAVLALGADEVSLGTALMIAEQCIFCHGCAQGMCPAGITTQSELVARRLMTIKKGRGKDDELPDLEEERYLDARQGVERYLRALAGDLRRKLAAMGVRRPADLTGRVELLQRRAIVIPDGPRAHTAPRLAKIDLAEILADPSEGRARGAATHLPIDDSSGPTSALNRALCDEAAAGAPSVHAIANTDRAVGATLAGRIASGAILPPEGGIAIALRGFAGQALGFACTDGMRIELEGFANDGVATAMGGGAIVVRPPDGRGGGEQSVIGNAAAYGATGGRLFARGRAGQRLGVRNSGAALVVEGAGKYAFEYMTGGVGVVLGAIGPVIGSGMTGGRLYLLADPGLEDLLHADVVARPLDGEGEAELRALLGAYAEATSSRRARELIAVAGALASRFVKVVAKG